jgi:hypothetical protein
MLAESTRQDERLVRGPGQEDCCRIEHLREEAMVSTPPLQAPPQPSHAPRLALAWGGGGIIVAAVMPLLWQVLGVYPPAGGAWLNWAWQPIAETASAVVLLAAFIVLAVGIGRETGIAGPSRVGQVALIAFAAVTLAVALYGFIPPDSFLSPMATLPDAAYDGTGQIDQQALVRAFWALQGFAYLGHAALVVASVFVIRARMLRGAARWGLSALALANILMDVVWRGTLGLELSLPILTWGALAIPLIQLTVGVLFVRQARVAAATPRLGVVTP